MIERAERRADVATLPRTCVQQGSLKRSIKYRVELSVGGFLPQRGGGGRRVGEGEYLGAVAALLCGFL